MVMRSRRRSRRSRVHRRTPKRTRTSRRKTQKRKGRSRNRGKQRTKRRVMRGAAEEEVEYRNPSYRIGEDVTYVACYKKFGKNKRIMTLNINEDMAKTHGMNLCLSFYKKRAKHGSGGAEGSLYFNPNIVEKSGDPTNKIVIRGLYRGKGELRLIEREMIIVPDDVHYQDFSDLCDKITEVKANTPLSEELIRRLSPDEDDAPRKLHTEGQFHNPDNLF